MPVRGSSVFRKRALHAYLENKQKTTLPRFTRPRAFIYFWGMLSLLLVGGGFIGSMRVPVYVEGTGLLIERRTGTTGQNELLLLSLVSPGRLRDMQVGQRVQAEFDGADRQLVARISSLGPGVQSPEAVREQFDLDGAMAGSVLQPVAVAVAKLEFVPEHIPPDSLPGSVFSIRVVVGSRRLFSFLSRSS